MPWNNPIVVVIGCIWLVIGFGSAILSIKSDPNQPDYDEPPIFFLLVFGIVVIIAWPYFLIRPSNDHL